MGTILHGAGSNGAASALSIIQARLFPAIKGYSAPGKTKHGRKGVHAKGRSTRKRERLASRTAGADAWKHKDQAKMQG